MSNDHPHGTLKSDIKTVKRPPNDDGEAETLAKERAPRNASADAKPY